MSMAYIRRTYGVPAKRGQRIKFNGKPGVILGSRNARLRIRLDGETFTANYHPTWNIEYPITARPAQAGSESEEACD